MSRFKEFTGKTLDEAIDQALKHFDVPREKLELEIVTGGSSGIFGLMSKKAVVKARLRLRTQEFKPETPVLNFDDAPKDKPAEAKAAPRQEQAPKPKPQAEPKAEPKAAPKPEPKAQAKEEPKPEPRTAPAAPAAKAEDAPAAEDTAPVAKAPERSAKPRREPRSGGQRSGNTRGNGERKPRRDTRSERPKRPAREERPRRDERDDAPRRQYDPANEPDTETLNACVREVVSTILKDIIGDVELTITNEPGRVKVRIEDEENSGLIIGREGQTITSLQYIVNRIVARKLQTMARVHLDAGDYRQRQDDNLQRMALYLADKAKNQNRTQSTKPLSSYHRRLVHLALQDDDSIVTSSKGDGPLKRVLIHPKRDSRPQDQA